MKRRNRYIAQDRIAMRIAARYGMTYDYKTARRNGLNPLEALEDWDMVTEEERKLFKNNNAMKMLCFRDKEGRIRTNSVFWAAVLVVLLLCVVYYAIVSYAIDTPNTLEKFGDMFGALGVLFSGLAFAGLIVTMLQQHEELQNQREDLKKQTEAIGLQRQEIALTNQELRKQRFETTFFSLLEVQQSVLRDMVAVNKYSKEEFHGRDAVFRHRSFVEDIITNEKADGKIEDYSLVNFLFYYETRLFESGRFDPYFSQIFTIMSYVDRNEDLTVDEKRKYIDILRSTMSFDEINLVFYYGLSKYVKCEYKGLIEKYAFFKGFNKECLMDLATEQDREMVMKHKSGYAKEAYLLNNRT